MRVVKIVIQPLYVKFPSPGRTEQLSELTFRRNVGYARGDVQPKLRTLDQLRREITYLSTGKPYKAL